MIRFKSCPRCKGDIRIDRDYYGWYEECIQCGYMRDLKSMVEVKQLARQAQEDKKRLYEMFKRGNSESPQQEPSQS